MLPVVGIFCCAFLLIASTDLEANAKKILVIGGTGRVGGNVVSKLISKGFETNVLVRDLEKAQLNPKLNGARLFPGDVANVDDIVVASRGCDAIVAAHGVRPARFSKLRDWFIHPKHDIQHPYNVNYIGTLKILAAMDINRINRLVRITGALVGKSAFYPFAALFNILLSKTVKWHEMSEIAIRKSGVDYTIIRPPEISSQANVSLYDSRTEKLFLKPADSFPAKKKVISTVSVVDVAEICSQTVTDDRFRKVTVVCGTEPGIAPSSWDSLVMQSSLAGNTISPDRKDLNRRNHELSTLLYTSVFVSIATGFLSALTLLSKFLYSKLRKSLMG